MQPSIGKGEEAGSGAARPFPFVFSNKISHPERNFYQATIPSQKCPANRNKETCVINFDELFLLEYI
jgi:hypothetical protein